MTDTLAFGALTICDSQYGDIYTRQNAGQIPALKMADISFIGTAGRELRIAGNQIDESSSLTLVYAPGQRGDCCIFKNDESTMESFLFGATNSIQSVLLDQTTTLRTLTDRAGSYTGMRMVSFRAISPIIYVTRDNASKVCIHFEAVFSRYTVP